MSADEMFESLEYKKIQDDNEQIVFIKKFKLKRPRHIIFYMDKTICVCEENEKQLAVVRDWFDMQELQAINKKCKELGWV